jgi:hypothetical protein
MEISPWISRKEILQNSVRLVTRFLRRILPAPSARRFKILSSSELLEILDVSRIAIHRPADFGRQSTTRSRYPSSIRSARTGTQAPGLPHSRTRVRLRPFLENMAVGVRLNEAIRFVFSNVRARDSAMLCRFPNSTAWSDRRTAQKPYRPVAALYATDASRRRRRLTCLSSTVATLAVIVHYRIV